MLPRIKALGYNTIQMFVSPSLQLFYHSEVDFFSSSPQDGDHGAPLLRVVRIPSHVVLRRFVPLRTSRGSQEPHRHCSRTRIDRSPRRRSQSRLQERFGWVSSVTSTRRKRRKSSRVFALLFPTHSDLTSSTEPTTSTSTREPRVDMSSGTREFIFVFVSSPLLSPTSN